MTQISIKDYLIHLQEHGQKKTKKYCFVMKGFKTLHCLDINNTTELLELDYDDLDFD